MIAQIVLLHASISNTGDDRTTFTDVRINMDMGAARGETKSTSGRCSGDLMQRLDVHRLSRCRWVLELRRREGSVLAVVLGRALEPAELSPRLPQFLGLPCDCVDSATRLLDVLVCGPRGGAGFGSSS
jgi:hypothetical protein